MHDGTGQVQWEVLQSVTAVALARILLTCCKSNGVTKDEVTVRIKRLNENEPSPYLHAHEKASNLVSKN